jgi:hypothetical protein
MSASGIQGLGVLVFSLPTLNLEKQEDAFHKMRQCLNAFFQAGPNMQSTRNSHFNIPWLFQSHLNNIQRKLIFDNTIVHNFDKGC